MIKRKKPSLFFSYILPLIIASIIVAALYLLIVLLFPTQLDYYIFLILVVSIILILFVITLTVLYLFRYHHYEKDNLPKSSYNITGIIGFSLIIFGFFWSYIPLVGVFSMFFILAGFIVSLVAYFINKPNLKGKGFINLGLTIGAFYIIAFLIVFIILLFFVFAIAGHFY
jgi:hypothetical protein